MNLQGQVVSHYRISGLVGSGGMGVVYRGEDTRLGRPVAIKFLPAGVLDDDAIQRFRREARAASALNHPYICTVYDVGEHDGAPFLVLEYLEGEPLADRLRRGALPVDSAIDLVAQIADALASAHGAGIVHRDVKPGNVFVTTRGDAKVLDFGLAKQAGSQPDDGETVAGRTPLTQVGTTLGTVAYMSPEQARAEEVDPRSDIFSLGVVLYEALTGKLPFRGSAPAVIFHEILGHTPPPPSQLNPDVPSEVDRIVMRALEKDRELRYQTAADLRADLRRLRHGSGVTSHGIAPAASRRSRSWVYVALAGVLACLAAVGWTLFKRAPSTEAPPTVAIKQLTNSGNAFGAALSPDGKFVAYLEQRQDQFLVFMRQIATGSTVQIAPPTTKAYAGLTISPDGNYVYAVRASDTPTSQTLLRIPVLGGEPRALLENVNSPVAVSRDGRQLAFFRRDVVDGAIMTAAADGSGAREVVKISSSDSWLPKLAWSPDGRHLAGLSLAGIRIVPAAGGEIATVAVSGWKLIESIFWTADDRFLVTAELEEGEMTSRHQFVRVSRSGADARRLTNDLNDYHGASFSSDGTAWAATQQSVAARLFISEASAPDRLHPITSGRGEGASGVSFLVGRRLVFADQLSEGWTINDDGSEMKPLPLDRRAAANVRACGDASVVYERIEQQRSRIYVSDLKTGSERFVAETSEQAFPACTADGRVVLYSAKGIQKIDVAGGTPTLLIERAHQPELSPDGTMIAYHALGPKGETFVVASATDGKIIRELAPRAPGRFRWDPSGRAIIAVQSERGVDNLWELPVDRSAKRQLTQFSEDTIFHFDVSRDGRLAISRGRGVRDVILMTLGTQPGSR